MQKTLVQNNKDKQIQKKEFPFLFLLQYLCEITHLAIKYSFPYAVVL